RAAVRSPRHARGAGPDPHAPLRRGPRRAPALGPRDRRGPPPPDGGAQAERVALHHLPHRYAPHAQVLPRLAHRELPEVEDARRQHGVGAADADAFVEVLEVPHATRGDGRERHAVGHGPGQREVEAVAGAVAIHAGDEALAGSGLGHALAPGDGVQAGGLAAAVGVALTVVALTGPAAGVDGDDVGLAAEGVGGAADEIGVGD